jgi:hypothetical protein
MLYQRTWCWCWDFLVFDSLLLALNSGNFWRELNSALSALALRQPTTLTTSAIREKEQLVSGFCVEMIEVDSQSSGRLRMQEPQ